MVCLTLVDGLTLADGPLTGDGLILRVSETLINGLTLANRLLISNGLTLIVRSTPIVYKKKTPTRCFKCGALAQRVESRLYNTLTRLVIIYRLRVRGGYL